MAFLFSFVRRFDQIFGYEESNWYAPKVGLVKSALKEESNNLLVGTGGTVIMELMETP